MNAATSMARAGESPDRRRFTGAIISAGLPLGRRQGYLPADFVSIFYLTVVSVLIAGWHARLENWPVWLGIHLALLVAVLSLRFLPRQGWPVFQLFRETYMLWLMPFSYHSVQTLNRILHTGYFDGAVLRWDQALFGGHPHTYLIGRFPFPPLSEFLHFCYLFYIILIPVFGLTLFFQKRFEALRAFTTTQALTMYGCYLIFIFYPVLGPWYTWPHAAIIGPGVFQRLVHGMLERGGIFGAAFPSSHVAGATAVAIMAFRFSRRLSYALALLALGIAVATVYGGFHYGIDALCGLVFGVGVGLVGPRVHAAILRRIRLAVIHLRFPHLRFRWKNGRIRGEIVRPGRAGEAGADR